jgi:hypothetical protein
MPRPGHPADANANIDVIVDGAVDASAIFVIDVDDGPAVNDNGDAHVHSAVDDNPDVT